jgi:hypothetical protein
VLVEASRRGVHKLSRLPNPVDLQEDRISAPTGAPALPPLFDQKPVGRANIAGEPRLARSPRVAPVAAVVEQQHRQARARQCARQRRSKPPVAGVSSHQHRDATVRRAGLDQSRAAAPGRRRSAASPPVPCDHRLRPWHLSREGKVDEAGLESDERFDHRHSAAPQTSRAPEPDRLLRMSFFAGKLSFRHPQAAPRPSPTRPTCAP